MFTQTLHPSNNHRAGNTMWKTFSMMLFLVILSVPASSAFAECLTPVGDIDGNGETLANDVQCVILGVWYDLGMMPEPACMNGDMALGDLNCDGSTNVVDVNISILAALEDEFGSAIDSDGNACIDSCEEGECGDGACNLGEDCETCSSDCGPCVPDVCCSAGDGPGCEIPACEDCVCAGDIFCCEFAWDDVCAEDANDACSKECNCEAPESDCCSSHEGPGCEDNDCTDCVCADDSFCCEVSWDPSCVEMAQSECVDSCGCFVDTDAGPCCDTNDSPACNDDGCTECVCEADSFCCETTWDDVCVNTAGTTCNDSCGCNTLGDCCEANDTAACSDFVCADCVCNLDSLCCDGVWDDACVALAQEDCFDSCGCEVGPACEPGQIPDCFGLCGTESWLGDGTCDDGAWGADFNCAEFDYDMGDCEPPGVCGDGV